MSNNKNIGDDEKGSLMITPLKLPWKIEPPVTCVVPKRDPSWWMCVSPGRDSSGLICVRAGKFMAEGTDRHRYSDKRRHPHCFPAGCDDSVEVR